MGNSNYRSAAQEPLLPALTIMLNYFGIVFITCGVVLAYLLTDSATTGVLLFLTWLYTVPPLLCRLLIKVFGKPSGIVRSGSKTLTQWWALTQLQLIFNRLPVFEELLRIIPGLYAIWLNAWGSKVSMFAFWSPGVVVMDRYHLHIEKGVILGSGCFISGHVLQTQKDGTTLLVVDKIIIEAGATVGVRATLGPGCHVHRFETVPANRLIKPYTDIKDGKKTEIISSSTYLPTN